MRFGNACQNIYTPKPAERDAKIAIYEAKIRSVIAECKDGYIAPNKIQELLDAAGIARAQEAEVSTEAEAVNFVSKIGYPVVMKVVGPVHKSDVGGVSLGVKSEEEVRREFKRIMQIPDATGVLIQNMLSGREIFIGANKDPKFGHIILAGFGCIFIEVLKDVRSCLVPVSNNEAHDMISP